ncbi:Gallinacin-8, partial [Phaethon lepturus]
GFMRVPNNDVQCKQAGGTCSTKSTCPLPNTRSFGRCQQGVPCCRTV